MMNKSGMIFKFRGIEVFKYNSSTKLVSEGTTAWGTSAFNHCRFIDEDFALMRDFFALVFKHRIGLATDEDLTNIIVS